MASLSLTERHATSKTVETVDFHAIRSDWYANGDYMVRLLVRAMRRQGSSPDAGPRVLFKSFPPQWIPVFEWLGVQWQGVSLPSAYLPFGDECGSAILHEVGRARARGQLRLLVETMASCETVLSAVLPALDAKLAFETKYPNSMIDRSETASIRLTNWHSYGRPEVRQFERDLRDHFRQAKRDVVFLPCGRARPYERSPTHRKLRATLAARRVNLAAHDVIVITSLGPVPEAMWHHPVVLRYDTGVRDVYRMLILFRRILHGVHYQTAWDCLALEPYRDLIRMLQTEGFVGKVKELIPGRSKRLAHYSVRDPMTRSLPPAPQC